MEQTNQGILYDSQLTLDYVKIKEISPQLSLNPSIRRDR